MTDNRSETEIRDELAEMHKAVREAFALLNDPAIKDSIARVRARTLLRAHAAPRR